ncbi:MAG: hypothetical protein HKN26_03910, partial [Acidimicrobiales bacterium]|nr:hypothetical protein [Acidimicrobiales bacterium]
MGRARAVGRDVVFNVVWIGDVFRFLYPFVSSLLAHSDARVRFVANGCTPASVEAMHHYASTGDGRVCEVLEVSPDLVIPHGVALDQVLSTRDDGPLFAVIDSDIKATGPFLPDLLRPLNDPADPAVAVTAGRAVWSEPVPAPLDTPWIVGGMFTRADGFVYGSVYAAIYRRDALDAMTQRWSVGFGTGGQGLDIPGTELAPAAAQHLRDNGHP